MLAWEYDRENTTRTHCAVGVWMGWPRSTVGCDDPEDNIPF